MNFFFFDLDGTLEDSRRDMVNAAQRVRECLSLESRTFEELVPHVNRGMRELYINCFKDFCLTASGDVDEEKILTIERLYVEHYGNEIAVHTQLYPGIRDLLTQIKPHGRIAVITNKPESLSHRLLEALQLSHLIDLVVGGDTCLEAKPSALPLMYALTQLGGTPERDPVFMIGDSQGDTLAGERAGVHSVWCAWGYQSSAPTQPAPKRIAATPQDLIEIFESFGASISS
jgi:phosphoglycolate phosphatase